MKKIIIAVLAALALSSCTKRAEVVTQSSNPNIVVEKLFTHDGITVYRFEDQGRSIYFSKPAMDFKHAYGCGKGCTATSTMMGAQ